MKVYQTSDIKNVAILGSINSGKTTLAEAMLFEGGVIDRRGTVEAKSTVSDHREIEQERLNTLYSTPLYAEWEGKKINFIDTPGLDDFVGEVYSSLKAVEVVLMMLNTQNGVEVGTEIQFRNVKTFNKPVIFVANQLDHEKSNFDDTVKAAKALFGNKVVVLQYPVGVGKDFHAIIDVLKMKMYKYPDTGGKAEILDIPAGEKSKAEELHNELIELAAENDEALMELFFENGSLSDEEAIKGVKLGIAGRNLFPVLCTSAKKNIGTQQLMSFIASALPGPHEIPAFMTTKGVAVPCDPKKPATVFVYKTAYEEHLGEMNYFKVISGEIPEGLELENIDTGSKEKFTQLFSIAGKKREKVEKLIAGDIGATIKLKNTKTNNSLSVKNTDIKIEPTPFPEPKFRVAIKAKNSAEDEKLAAVLNRMHAEDPTLIFEYSKELKQMILSGQGEMHINIAKWHLDKIHKVETEFMNPKIPYRETITKQALADYKHKKQSGGAGQFGEVFLMLEPYEEGKPDPDKNIYTIRAKDEINLPWGGKLIYYNAIVGGVIDARFLPAILKGIMEKIEEGPLTGSYARDIRVTVYDGKMHPVDSNEISFKLAGRHAFQKAFKIAGPKLLEPVYRVEVVVPEERMGDVMTDLQGRRAMIEGMGGEGIYQKITARVPLAEMNKYSTTLSSLTNGRASYTMKFFDYLPVPPDVQEKLLKEYEEAHKEEE
jgi:elongation factor G